MTVVVLLLVGLGAGSLAAALGVGGGVIYVPALVAVLSLGQHEAQGTSLAVIVPTALLATYVHHRGHRVRWAVWPWLAAGGLIGGLAGALIALDLDETVLRRLFAAFLVVTALRLLVRSERANAPSAGDR